MITNKKELTIDLPYTYLQAKIVIEHAGQELPGNGDRIKVIATILLPCGNNPRFIDSKITFDNRIRIAEECLYNSWGYNGPEGYRKVEKEFLGTKWTDVEVEAEVWADNQVDGLVDALIKRHDALQNAE